MGAYDEARTWRDWKEADQPGGPAVRLSSFRSCSAIDGARAFCRQGQRGAQAARRHRRHAFLRDSTRVGIIQGRPKPDGFDALHQGTHRSLASSPGRRTARHLRDRREIGRRAASQAQGAAMNKHRTLPRQRTKARKPGAPPTDEPWLWQSKSMMETAAYKELGRL